MGTALQHAIGWLARFYAKPETTFGTFVQPTAAAPGSFKAMSLDIAHDRARKERLVASSGTRAVPGYLLGKLSSTWSAEAEVIPSGTLGTPPEADALLKQTFGGKKITRTVTVASYATAVGDTVTVTVDGAATVLTGVAGAPGAGEFQAATSNNATATSLASAISAIAGIRSATANSAVITVITNDDVETMTIAPSDSSITTAGVSVTYEPVATQGARGSVSLTAYRGPAMVAAKGAWVDEYKLTHKGGDAPVQAWSGGAKAAIATGKSTINGAPGGGGTTVTPTDVRLYEIDSVVQYGDDTNSGGGFKVTARSDAGVLTTAATTASSGDDILPFAPTPSYTGSPLEGTDGSVTVDAVALVGVTEWELTYRAGSKVVNDIVMESSASDVLDVRARAELKAKLRLREDQWALWVAAKNDPDAVYDLSIVLGSTAGRIVEVTMPTCEIHGIPAEMPDEEAIVELTFVGVPSSFGASDVLQVIYR